jgi:peptidoglycan hydrolase CwlO-like protein
LRKLNRVLRRLQQRKTRIKEELEEKDGVIAEFENKEACLRTQVNEQTEKIASVKQDLASAQAEIEETTTRPTELTRESKR